MSFALKSSASAKTVRAQPSGRRAAVVVRAGKYDEELIKTAHAIASKGKGIMAMDESNATCGKRLDSIGVENTEENRRAYRELLLVTPGLGQYISGAILFEETLYQSTKEGKTFVQVMQEAGIVPGIKVDKGLVPMVNSNGESWCMGLDGLDARCSAYYKAGARFSKWRSVISIPQGPSMIAQRDCAYGLARYAAIAQSCGLVPIIEPEVMLDGEQDIDQAMEAAQNIWAETFKYMADNKVLFEGVLLKPAMVTPGADCAHKAGPEKVAEYTLKMLRRRVPPAVPGIMFLSGGQSELESTLNLNAMNQAPNPWHVSFSYARALQNSVLKTWQGKPENVDAAQKALLARAEANSMAQMGKYDPSKESKTAGEGMFEKGYVY
jgi:fructose-bisphosphate aldolase class I